MADTVRRVEYHYVTVPDAPGEGQRILSALKDGGVNLLAYLGFPLGGGQSQIDLFRKTRGRSEGSLRRPELPSARRSRPFSCRAMTVWEQLPTRRRSSPRRTSTSPPPQPPAQERGAMGWGDPRLEP